MNTGSDFLAREIICIIMFENHEISNLISIIRYYCLEIKDKI